MSLGLVNCEDESSELAASPGRPGPATYAEHVWVSPVGRYRVVPISYPPQVLLKEILGG